MDENGLLSTDLIKPEFNVDNFSTDEKKGPTFVPPFKFKENSYMLEMVHEFGNRIYYDFYNLKGGERLVQELSNDKFDLEQEVSILYTERGRTMLYTDYVRKWTEAKRNDTKAIAAYVEITENSPCYSALKEFIINEMEKMALLCTDMNNFDEKSALNDIVSQIEGCHVTQSRAIGDMRLPFYVSYGGMLWRVQGYSRLSRRLQCEIKALGMELGSIEKLKEIIEANIYGAEIARVIETQMALTSLRHTNPTKQQFSSARDCFAAELFNLKKTIKR